MSSLLGRLCFVAVFIWATVAILSRAFFEPEPAKALVNFESAAAVAFFGCLLLCTRTSALSGETSATGGWPFFVPFLAVPPFLLAVRAPLLYDSYSHVVTASTQSLASVARTAYVHPTSGDFFFRPLGYLDYWVEYKWAKFDSLLWHINGILFHLVAIYLVFILCRKLHLSAWASSLAALLFGLHGTNPEVVFWTAARFDELATIFVLLTVIFACEYADKRKPYVPMLAACICALLSKESAFCVAGVLACCLWYRKTLNQSAMKALAGVATASVAVFIYRYWVIGSIGGYRDVHGMPTILHLNPVRSAELFLLRIWGVLLFPINWSVRPQVWLDITLILFIAAALLAMAASRPARRMIAASIVFCIVAILPAAHLAALNATIIGSRVFHLATIGLALMAGAIYDGFSNKRLAIATLTIFVAFQCAALVHNLLIWRDTAYLAKATCTAFPPLAATNQPVAVLQLPSTHNGAYFLANGFSDCVFVNSGARIAISQSTKRTTEEDTFKWDERSKSIKKEKLLQ